MKRLFNKIFHSDNLAVSCIKRFFVLFCVWLWNVWSLYSLYTYPPMYVYTKLKYEAESLAIHTIFFFMLFLAICMVDAIWVKESGKRNIWRYIAKQIIPMIPFLVICPILYNIYPDKNLSNIFLAVQWLQVIITDSLLWGSILTAGIVVLIVILFFVVPFLLFPKISACAKKLYENIRFRCLKKRYTECKKVNVSSVEFFAETNSEISLSLQSVCDVFNESLQSYFNGSDGFDEVGKRIGIYFAGNRVDGIYHGKNGAFIVANVHVNDDENMYDVTLLADKCIHLTQDVLRNNEFDEFAKNSDDIVEYLLKTADAFYPKDSGLKRL